MSFFLTVWIQVDKAPLESYADIGGLEPQIQEIKEAGMRFCETNFHLCETNYRQDIV